MCVCRDSSADEIPLRQQSKRMCRQAFQGGNQNETVLR